MIDINMILRANPDCKTLFEGYARFLGVRGNVAWLTRLDLTTKRREFIVPLIKAPFPVPMDSLLAAVEEGFILLGQEFDTQIPASRELLSTAALKAHDNALVVMKPLLDKEDLLFDPRSRAREFQSRAGECHVSERTIGRYYNAFFWGGAVDLALAPFLRNRGGPGKPQEKGERRGRKSKKKEVRSNVKLYELREFLEKGKVKLFSVRELLEKGARLYYLPGHFPLETAFALTKKYYFSIKPRKELDNYRLVEIVPP